LARPTPKPTAIKAAEGNRGKRKPRNEPRPRPVLPPVPAFVAEDPIALAYWKQYEPLLDRMGVLTEVDGLAFGSMCVEAATYTLACRKIAESDHVQKASTGWEQPSSWLTVRQKALKNLESLAARFGLTPADRTKIEVRPPDAKETDPVAEVIAITSRKAAR
jgi:P27 family predicted phage terminase small subunit